MLSRIVSARANGRILLMRLPTGLRAWTVEKRTGALTLSYSEPKAHSDRITASRWLGNYLYTGALCSSG